MNLHAEIQHGIDQDTDENDPVAFDDLELHRGYCRSLHCSYALTVQRAFVAEPVLQGLLGTLVFALEMVRESEVEWMRDADHFFRDLLGVRVCEAIEAVLVRFE